LGLGEAAKLLAVDPALAAIGGLEDRSRPGADEDLTRLRVLQHGPYFLIDDALIDLRPMLAAILAAEHAALVGPRKKPSRVVLVGEHLGADHALALEAQRPHRVVVAAVGLRAIDAVVRPDVEHAIGCGCHLCLLGCYFYSN